MVHGPMFSDFSTLMQIPCALITGNGPRTMSRITSEARTQHSGNVLYRYGSSICMGAGTEKLKTIIIALNIHTPFFFLEVRGYLTTDHGQMTSISNYLCQTLSSVARQIVGRPIFPTEIGREVGGLIGSRPKYLDPIGD